MAMQTGWRAANANHPVAFTNQANGTFVMTFKITAIALSSVLALGFASCGQAAYAQSTEYGVEVSYTDLNITTEAGAKTLLHRIHKAAEAYCGGESHVPLDQQRAHEACVTDAVDTTVAGLNVRAVTAMNNGQSVPTDLASAR